MLRWIYSCCMTMIYKSWLFIIDHNPHMWFATILACYLFMFHLCKFCASFGSVCMVVCAGDQCIIYFSHHRISHYVSCAYDHKHVSVWDTHIYLINCQLLRTSYSYWRVLGWLAFHFCVWHTQRSSIASATIRICRRVKIHSCFVFLMNTRPRSPRRLFGSFGVY